MSQVPNATSSVLASGSSSKSNSASSALNDVNLDDFLDLMIAELQNQDPLNPLENDQLVAQISQMRQVGATEQLSATLDAVLLGQNIASATNLIGAQIKALSDDNQRVSGIVERVSVAGGQPKLHLDLNPRADAVEEDGAIAEGTYEYRVVWQEDGNLFGVDPLDGGTLTLNGTQGVESAVEISNLPTTPGSKQIYRRNVGAGGDFQLVDVVISGDQASYMDTKADSELSQRVLTGTPQMVTSERSFEVSLKNVSEIKPPGV
ncbi:MAG: hypothetical protein KDA61_15225 [Planctomycetales bacterium]|nr:hypothetical protein [Planctomycetales bacterium]